MRIFSDRWLFHPVFVFWIQELPRQDVAWVSRTGCSLCVWHELQSSDMWLVKYQLLHSAHTMRAAECWGRYLWDTPLYPTDRPPSMLQRTARTSCPFLLLHQLVPVVLLYMLMTLTLYLLPFSNTAHNTLSTTFLFFMALHRDLISTAYESHEGVLQTKQWLSELYWWLNMDTEVINAIHFCHLCQLIDQFYLCQMAHGISLL